MEQKAIKNTGRKALYLPALFLLVFGLFIYGITRPTPYSHAVAQLEAAFSVEDIKRCWDQYKADLYEDQSFVAQIRNKLESLNLTDSEATECKRWLPPVPVSINLIIVPDLSKRIADAGNNPDQIHNDSVLLEEIWSVFEKTTRTKTDSKDRLMVDVTDNGQAAGQFRTIADNLVFDLSTHTAKSNRLFFESEHVKGRFRENIGKLYRMARQNPIGADYWYYFNRSLKKKMLKSTFSNEYRNVLIMITDGYLEAQNSERTGVSFYTGNYAQRYLACAQLKRGVSVPEAISRSELLIRDCQDHFPELEVLILEVNERSRRTKQEPFDPGTACDYDLLRYVWSDWFKRLEIRNAQDDFFIQRNDAIELTKKEITGFMISDNNN